MFVRGAYPGERVRARVLRSKGQLRFALAEEVLHASPDRVSPRCRQFGDCGACHLQDISYEAQLALKREVLADVFRRVGGIRPGEISILSGTPFHYRFRVDLQVSPSGGVGFFRERSHDVVEAAECPVLIRPLEGMLPRFADAREWLKGIRELRLAGDGSEGGVLLRVFGRGRGEPMAPPPSAVVEHLAGWKAPGGMRGGKRRVFLQLGEMSCSVDAGSFFQAHWGLNRELVGLVSGWLEGADSVADLYGGAGNLSLLYARNGGRPVVVFEGEPSSVRLGVRNLRENGIDGVRFVCGNVGKTWTSWKDRFDAVILDPPRAGASRAVLKAVIERKPRKIVYVSCEPATLSRDLKELIPHFDIREVRLVDLFPQTFHIETAVLLERT